jgi:hypothetical protein
MKKLLLLQSKMNLKAQKIKRNMKKENERKSTMKNKHHVNK